GPGEAPLGLRACVLDAPRKLLLLVGCEERHLGDVAEVDAEELAAAGGGIRLVLVAGQLDGIALEKRFERLAAIQHIERVGLRLTHPRRRPSAAHARTRSGRPAPPPPLPPPPPPP